MVLVLRGWGGVSNILRKTLFGLGSLALRLRCFFSGGINETSIKRKLSEDEAKPLRLSFDSQEDALNYARHFTENSKRRFAAYNLIERYIDGDYYICVSEWCRVGGDNQIYDLIFSSIPFKLGNRDYNRSSIDANRLNFSDDGIGDNIYLGKFSVLVCDTHAIERVEKVVPSFVWLERAKKRYDVRRNFLAAPLDNALQSCDILSKGGIGTFRVGYSRGDSNSIGRVVKRSPEMFNGFSSNEGEIITGERFSKSDLVQIVSTIQVTLYDIGPLFCLEKSSFPFFKNKDVLLCARETEF